MKILAAQIIQKKNIIRAEELKNKRIRNKTWEVGLIFRCIIFQSGAGSPQIGVPTTPPAKASETPLKKNPDAAPAAGGVMISVWAKQHDAVPSCNSGMRKT